MKSKIPISIAPFYWVSSAIIAYINTHGSGNFLLGMIAWMVVIFVSILVHEFGHALSAKMFGQSPRIRLVAFGGLTIPGDKKIKRWQEFIVILCGPLFGFCLFLIALGVKSLGLFTGSGFMPYMINIFIWVNLFWTAINLIPIIPLDGGQMMRVIFQSIFKKKGEKIALIISMGIGVVLAMYLMSYSLFLGIIVFLFLFQNVAMFRQLQYKSQSDEKEEITILYRQAAEKLDQGDKAGAKELFFKILEEAKSGIIFSLTSQALGKMAFEEKHYDEVYAYLEPVQKQVRGESMRLLHESAFYLEHFDTVKTLSRECYKRFASYEVAMMNAKVYATSGDIRHALGWLSAALEKGSEKAAKEVTSHYFDPIRDNKHFQALIKQ